MEPYRIKIKFGEHEFEAEGPVEAVQQQFEAFKEMVSSAPKIAPIRPVEPERVIQPQNNGTIGELRNPAYSLIMKAEGREISLTALPGTITEAALLIALGQKAFRSNDSVTGNEIRVGLEQSGYKPTRIDRVMDQFVSDGLVMKIGLGKATRYRLTNQGFAKATEIAGRVLDSLPK